MATPVPPGRRALPPGVSREFFSLFGRTAACEPDVRCWGAPFHGAAGHQPAYTRRRICRAPRAVRVWQKYAPAHYHRAAATDGGTGVVPWPTVAGGEPPHHHCVSDVCAVSLADRAAKCRGRAESAWGRTRAARTPRHRFAGQSGAGWL